MNKDGYTLLELCLTISLFSILLFTSLPPLLSQLQKQETQQFISQLSSDLSLTQSLARTEQQLFYLEMVPTQHFYLIYSPYSTIKRRIEVPIFLQISSNFAGNRIVYDGNGHISQGGSIIIKNFQGKEIRFVIQLSSGRFWVQQ